MEKTTTQRCSRSFLFVLSLVGKLLKLNKKLLITFSFQVSMILCSVTSGKLKIVELILITTKPDSEFQNSICIFNLQE